MEDDDFWAQMGVNGEEVEGENVPELNGGGMEVIRSGGSAEVDGGVEDIAQQLEDLEKRERKARKRRPGSFWKKPPTFVYADNFGFGVNGYQSMIDYLDVKDSGGTAHKDEVHLPLLEERCMRQYHSSKPIHWYHNTEIDRYIDKGERIRTQIRQNDAVGVSNVLRRTHTNWSMTRKWVQLVKRSSVGDYRNLHRKSSEFEDTAYRAPTPIKPINYRALTPKPRYLDDLSAEFASVLRTLAQSRMEHEQAMASRRERLKDLDNKFETTVDNIYEQMKRVSERADNITSDYSDPRCVNYTEMAARNRARRAEEMRELQECVNDLTGIDSARNTLRGSLRSLDNEVLGLSSRVDDMRKKQASERLRDLENDCEIDRIKTDIASRRSSSRATSQAIQDFDDEAISRVMSYRRPRVFEPMPPPTRVTLRPREPLHREEVISDVHARVINKAGEFGDRTSEQRRINSRARFVNLYRPRPDTADIELMVPPSRTELNIDHMAKTLATRGAYQRRYDIDDELDPPFSHLNTNAHRDYCEMGARDTIKQHPSISNRVRYAVNRARARNSMLGY